MDNSLKPKEKTPKRGANAPQKIKTKPFLVSKELKTKDLRKTAAERASGPTKPNPNPRIAYAKGRVKPPARLDLAGKHGRKTMIRKKWNGDELVLSVETEDEFWKALTTGEAVELTRELGDQIGLMEDETITEAEVEAARNDPSD